MTTFVETRAIDLKIGEDSFTVELEDGRTLIVPLAWSPRLMRATVKQRKNWEFIGGGYGIHWPDVDEDLSIEGLLRGLPSIETVRPPKPHLQPKILKQALHK